MSAAARKSRPDVGASEPADHEGAEPKAYGLAAGKARSPKWFEGRQRRKIDPIGSSAIDWPTDLTSRHQVHRDWHTVALRRARAASVDTEVLGLFWRFVNLTEAPGKLWPGNDLVADISGVSLKTVTRQVAAYEALGLIKTRRRWIGRNGNKQQVREIELTFPADLSRGDFAGIAFVKGAWQRYVKDADAKSDEAMRGPVTDDDSPESDEAMYGPASDECPPGTDGTMGNPTDGTIPGLGTVEVIVEGEGFQPSPSPPDTSTSLSGSDAHKSASGLNPVCRFKIGEVVDVPHYEAMRVEKIGFDGSAWFLKLREDTVFDVDAMILPLDSEGEPQFDRSWWQDGNEAKTDRIDWNPVDRIVSPAPKTGRQRHAAA